MFDEFVETGRISTRGLVAFIRGEFARLLYERYLANSVANFASGFWNLLNGVAGGGGFGLAGGTGTPLVDLGLGAGRAAGGPVSRGKLYRVNEEGSELLSVRGRQYLIPGADGAVTAAHKWQRESRSSPVVLNVVNNFHGETDRNKAANMINFAIEGAVAKVADMRRRGHPAFI